MGLTEVRLSLFVDESSFNKVFKVTLCPSSSFISFEANTSPDFVQFGCLIQFATLPCSFFWNCTLTSFTEMTISSTQNHNPDVITSCKNAILRHVGGDFVLRFTHLWQFNNQELTSLPFYSLHHELKWFRRAPNCLCKQGFFLAVVYDFSSSCLRFFSRQLDVRLIPMAALLVWVMIKQNQEFKILGSN